MGDFAQRGRQWARAGKHAAFLQHISRVQSLEDRLELVEQHRMWGQVIERQAAKHPIRRPASARAGGKHRIGFLSSDLRNHPVGYFALPVLEFADRERFEVYCYSFYTGQEDGTQKYIASKIDHFRWRKDISDRDAAQMIADDDLDILFELGGSTHMNKIDVMAYRPAPLQASWLGYPHSVGLSTIDYLLTDPYITPPDARMLIEQPLIMPKTWIALGRLPSATSRPSIRRRRSRATASSPSARPTTRINTPPRCWPSGPGWWRPCPARSSCSCGPRAGVRTFRENMLAAFAAEGVSADRVRFEAVRGAHLPFYNEIDISLDSFPLTGGTTTCEALWMGVPVVSLVGEAFFERLSHSILNNAGLGHLSTRSIEAYVEAAMALAADPEQRRTIRETLRDRIKAGAARRHPRLRPRFLRPDGADDREPPARPDPHVSQRKICPRASGPAGAKVSPPLPSGKA
ncbi:MAG: hypothetical protein WDM92_00450 [Caulobacteraceae bacterium]